VGALLVGLWLLEAATGAAQEGPRRRVAWAALAREGVRRLAAPHLDARGRPRQPIDVRMATSGPAACGEAVREVLRGGGLLAQRSTARPWRLEIRCRETRPGSTARYPSAQLGLELVLTPPGGPAARVTLTRRVGGYLALAAPLVAVVLALATGRILLSLLLGVICAAFLFVAGSPERLSDPPLWRLLLLPVDLGHAVGLALWADVLRSTLGEFKLQLVGFAVALVGLVAVVTRAGGTAGLLRAVGRLGQSPRLAQLSAVATGMVIFFDDLASTLVSGSTARPLTDAARVSREKLAYLVDSTSAPVAGLAVVSTWVGFEVGLFQAAASSIGLPMSGFEIFFGALPLRFYCLFILFLVVAGVVLGRDLGPMLAAERRAATTGTVLRPGSRLADGAALAQGAPPAGLPPAGHVALVPVLAVLGGVLGGNLILGHHTRAVQVALAEGLYRSGSGAHLQDCFAQAAKADLQGWALLGSGLIAVGLAFLLAARRRRYLPPDAPVGALSLRDLARTFVRSWRTVAQAIGILIGAWAIQAACDRIGAATTLAAALSGALPPLLFPVIVFGTAAGLAFATGTSWGAMAMLIPTVLPLAHALGGPDDHLILFLSAGAVLDGAIFGDHCSPVSDTTILSSLAAQCDHLDHVRTQLPYALIAMAVAALFGYLGRPAGLAPAAVYALAAATLLAVLLVVGRNPRRT
jgi:Na+/H+ antiporter NhaC